MEKIKVGIIGVGGISGVHIDAYKKNPNVELCAFCDIVEERAKRKAEQHGVKGVYTDANEMLAKEELDAVSVCTWNSAHAECAIAALKAGKHVLCEKPMAMNVEQALEMEKAAKESGKLLMVGFVRRYGNDMKILKDYIDNGYFGELYYAKATYLRRNGNPGGWFGDSSRSGGGPLIDLGVHVIDFVRYAFGNPKPVSVYGVTFKKLGNRPDVKGFHGYSSESKGENDICDVEDMASVLIRFDNGAALNIETSFTLNLKDDEGKIQLFGTKAGACINPELELYTNINGYMTDVKFKAPTALSFGGLFESEINHFVDCILGKVECISPAEDGVELMRILSAAYESARTGHEVIL